MSVNSRLVFDPNEPASSHNVGSYVRAGDDGTQIGSQNINSDDWLNVASALFDGSGNALVSTGGALHVDIQDAEINIASEYAEDSAHVSGDIGGYVLSVREDSLAVSTSASGDYQSLKTNNLGELYTTDVGAEALLTTIDADTGNIATSTGSIDTKLTSTNALLTTIDADTSSIDSTLSGLSHLEDAAHVSGDAGMQMLSVRNDTLASLVSADGDYAPLQVSAAGALYVNIAEGSIATSDAALANVAIDNESRAVSTSSIAVTASVLSGRKYLFLANEGNKSLYYGEAGVTAANGFPLHPGMQAEIRVGATPVVNVIGETGASSEDLRVMQMS